MLKRCTVWLTVLALSYAPALARRPPKDHGYGVTYDGGSIPSVNSGSPLRLYIDPTEIRFVGCAPSESHRKRCADLMQVTIPASAITEISYGQDVHRRVGTAIAVGIASFGLGALVALSKSKKHFVGLTWVDGDKRGGLAMQCDKKNYRGILAGIEGISGKKAVDSATMTVKN